MTSGFYLHVVTLPDTINAATSLNASSESYAEEMAKPILSDDNLESKCSFTNKWIIVLYNYALFFHV